MLMLALPEFIQKNINLKHISCFIGEYSKGQTFLVHQEKPRARTGFVYIEGEIMLTSENKKTAYHTGDLLCFPATSRYTYKVEEDNTKIYSVNFVLCNEDDEEVTPFSAPTLLAHVHNDMIREQFLRCLHLFRTSTNRIALKGETFSLFSSVVLLYTSENAPSNIQGAIDTIRNNIHDELRISDLAAACGMSESTFRREFHRYAGVSPKQYILDRKINKAKQMLRSGYYPIKEICLILGFYDDAYFSKLFKKATGMTPMQYAQEKSKV